MLYVVRAFDHDDMFVYEYGDLKHAEEHYERESTAHLIEYSNGSEIIIRSKYNGKEQEIWIWNRKKSSIWAERNTLIF